MARIESWYKQDLKKPVPIRRMETVFNQDALGHLFGVEVYDNGEAVSLAGSVTGYCLLADGTTVPVAGTGSANKASIVIPQTAYSVIGPITITVKLTEGSAITTLLAVVGMVARSRTGQQVNPGSTITDWTNQISAQLQAVQTAADNLGSTLAAPFSTTVAYTAGTYVMYNGNLYRFTKDHAAGDWSSSEVTQVKACNEISDLKSAFKGSVNSLYLYDYDITWYQGSIKNNGTNASNSACCRTDMIHLGEYPLAFFVPSDFLFYIVEYSSNEVSSFIRMITPVYSSGDFAFTPTSGYYYRIVVKKQSGADFTPSDSALANVELFASANTNDIILNIKDSTAIRENDDLNDYVTQGRYTARNSAITETLSNCPVPNTGFDLIVTVTSDRNPGEYIRQILLKNNRTDNAVYIRYKGETWGEWEPIHDSNWAYLLNTNLTTEIPANADLDTYTEPGRYSARNTAITKTLLNSPIPDTGFDLFVTATSGHTEGTYVRQILIKNSKTDNSIFIRYLGLTWGEWQRISMASSKLAPIQLDEVTIRPLSARNTDSAKLTIKVGTFNVARYNHDTDVYLEDEPQLLLNIRNWLNDNNLDILFTQEDTGYINFAKSKTSYDYLFKGFFNADPVNTGDSTDVARANKKIFTTLPINTNGTVVHLDNNANPPAVYPSGHIYEGQTITAYFVWSKQEIANVGTVMLIDLHNFYNGGKNSHTEWHPYQNRVLFLDLISTFLASQEYDYCIIAGDFNASNKDGKNDSGSNVPIDGKPYGDWDAILDFCEENNLIPCNGGLLEWFKTNGSSALDNILVSDNIRIEKVECEPNIREALYSDHAPIIAKISFT